MDQSNSLESLKNQLINSLKTLKEREESLIASENNQEEQNKNEIEFKNNLDLALNSLSRVPKSFTLASNQISSIYSIAQDLSFRINVVDEAYSRCQSAAKHVQMFADLVECLNSIGDAIESKDISKSCQIMSRLIEIPQNLLSQQDSEKISKYRQMTLELLRKQMKEEQDAAVIFGYYEKCGAQVEGVKEFTNIQFQQITQQENHKYMTINQMKPSPLEDKQESPHIQVFVEFLNTICVRVDGSKSIIKDSGQLAVFIRLLLQLSDQRMKQIIEAFVRYRSVTFLLDPTSLKPEQYGFSSLVCEEMATISREFTKFQKFLSNLIKQGQETEFFKNYAFEKKTNPATGLPVNSESERQVLEILSYYTILTNNFANLVIRQDMLEKLNFQRNQETMDMISDIFFFFNEILTRTFRANSAKTAVSVCNLISELVRTLFEVLKEKDRSLSKYREINGLFGTLWNSSDMTNVYILKLVETFEKFNKHFTGDDSEVITSTITEYKTFSDDLKKKINAYLRTAMQNLLPSIESLVNIFRQSWTVDTEKHPINVELEMNIESDFTNMYERTFVDYFKTLNKSNKEQLISQVSQTFAIKFEELVRSKRFDKKGGVLLDRLVKFLCKTLAEKPFGRLKQISFILSKDTKDDIEENIGENLPFDWTLSKDEMRKICELRIDWRNS